MSQQPADTPAHGTESAPSLREAVEGAPDLVRLLRCVADRSERHEVRWQVLLSPQQAKSILAALA